MAIYYNMLTHRDRFVSHNFISTRSHDDKAMVVVSGVALVHFDESGSVWKRDRIYLGIDVRFAVPSGRALMIRSHVPLATVNTASINAPSAVCAVDAFGIASLGPLNEMVWLWADVACLNASLVRIGYHVTAIADSVDRPAVDAPI
jgi:hypothetical protein